jgi:glycosyltransferase involved in cell wall biosynthesis
MEGSDRPIVSIIIPVKNGERFLAAAIRSVTDQDYRPIEIIVVDGQSNDGTHRIAHSFPEVRYIYQEEEPGLAQARNLGIQSASGEMIAFISHDDLWAPRKLSLQVDYLLRHPEIQYVIGQVRFFLEPGCALPAGFRPELLTGIHSGPMPETLLAHKSLFSRIGDFNAGYPLGEDVDWFVRARDSRVPAALIPEVLVFKRVHDSNLSTSASYARSFQQDLVKLVKESLDRKRGAPERPSEGSGT